MPSILSIIFTKNSKISTIKYPNILGWASKRQIWQRKAF